jgi:hypothetical protein
MDTATIIHDSNDNDAENSVVLVVCIVDAAAFSSSQQD